MNTLPEATIVDSSQLTPVYLINPNDSQANYIITLGDVEQKPISDNLKSFYEKSGSIENSIPNVIKAPAPRTIKKIDPAAVGNNLKLASFLLPKTEPSKPYVLNNVILKPSLPAVSNTRKINLQSTEQKTPNTIPVFGIDRKIVKLKDGMLTRRNRVERALPKIKPKENTSTIIPPTSKLTSVQLIKLGETYHSLNKLNDDQVKMVNHALKIFSDPEKIVPEPTYDPVTNTKFIYKVISPKDLVIAGKKNIIFKEKKEEKKIEIPKKEFVKKQIVIEDFVDEPELPAVTKVTRSGRTVKHPKLIVPQDTPQKPKKKNHVVTCFQCSTEFASLYRLQKHYENHPTHIPAKIHSNLFHCLLAIVKGGSEEDRTNIFIQQLEQLIVKLKSLLPCLLNTMEGNEGKPCTINDDIGRILGMDPGKYNIDVNALSCIKDKDGFCMHNPSTTQNQSNVEVNQPSELLITNHEEAMIPDTEDCARISSAENWPTVNKRVWKLKKLKAQNSGAKKIRLDEKHTLLELDLAVKREEDLNETKRLSFESEDLLTKLGIDTSRFNESMVASNECNDVNNKVTLDQSKNNHIQFHSTHFDIRSSPIKPTSTVFRKFQITPDKLSNYDGQIIGAVNMVDKAFEETNNINGLINNDIELPCKENAIDQSWILSSDKSEDGFTKPDSLIEPSLIHVKDTDTNKVSSTRSNISDVTQDILTNVCSESNQSDSVLNFLDSLGSTCLSYPGMEIRSGTSDFNLDLFSFTNT
ncbi:uncharacterized protein LOC114239778 [Bombyx mandarina]|uniref:C2H2-type domain-containing protein n=2 Tax=Bombyx TaxID=7090 RepID=A0A8R2AMW8_BOMMO|nr:uncharacterized protein LOC101737353 [Bombyx mori]XP_028025961.1 uncharacterized protein LOC114239778 [Bombyx mandarina]